MTVDFSWELASKFVTATDMLAKQSTTITTTALYDTPPIIIFPPTSSLSFNFPGLPDQ